MPKDNKKNEYVAPVSLSTKDLVDIKIKGIENSIDKPDQEVNVHELVNYIYKDSYNEDLYKTAQETRKHHSKDFYIELVPYVDQFLILLYQKNITMKSFDRVTCPTPQLGHHVYKVYYDTGTIEELWIMPDEYNYNILHSYKNVLYDDCLPLIKYVEKFDSGELMKLSNKLNGITQDDLRDKRILKFHDLDISTDTKYKDNKD